MNVIIIGAGRGARVMPYSQHAPKCFTEVNGKRILDYTLEALKVSDHKGIHFIGGYLIDVVKKDYPHFIYHHNHGWETNNVLASLFYAEPAMKDGFISTYADILFTPEVIQKISRSPHDITIAIDTDWKSRYQDRSQHPMEDAEKVLMNGNQITKVARDIPNDEADGEFIGVAKFTPRGAEKLREYYHVAKQNHDGKQFRGAAIFRKAYLIHLLQEMIEKGEKIHFVTTHGGYFEIDTVEDLGLASEALKRKGGIS